MKQVLEHFVKAAHAAKSCRQGNLGHGHAGFMNQLLGKEHTPGLRHCNGRRAQMLEKQSPELTVSYSKSFRQFLDVRVVTIERPIGNKSECPGNGIRSSAP
jgi:hypothetical protein